MCCLNRGVFRPDLKKEIDADVLRQVLPDRARYEKDVDSFVSVLNEGILSKQSSIRSRTKLTRKGVDSQQFRRIF